MLSIITGLISSIAPIFLKLFGVVASIVASMLSKLAIKVGEWVINKISNFMEDTFVSKEEKASKIMYLASGDESYLDASQFINRNTRTRTTYVDTYIIEDRRPRYEEYGIPSDYLRGRGI